MAIARSYQKDTNIQNSDLFLGTKSSNLLTVNYTAQAIADYLNSQGKVSIAGQMSYRFVIEDRTSGTISFPIYGGNGAPLSSISNFVIAIRDISGANTTDFMDYLINSQILMSLQNEPSIFGHYRIVSYTPIDLEFYSLDLQYIGGNGNITENKIYDIISFSLSNTTGGTYIYTQTIPEAVWTIQHDLDKFPSVTVVNINNVVLYGEMTYIDSNSLQITFSGGFSGKAFLN